MFSDKIWLISQKVLRNTFFKGIEKRAQKTEIPAFFDQFVVTTKNPPIPAIFGPKSDIFAIEGGIYPELSADFGIEYYVNVSQFRIIVPYQFILYLISY